MKLKELKEKINISGDIKLWTRSDSGRGYKCVSKYINSVNINDDIIRPYDEYEVVEIDSESIAEHDDWINIYLNPPKTCINCEYYFCLINQGIWGCRNHDSIFCSVMEAAGKLEKPFNIQTAENCPVYHAINNGYVFTEIGSIESTQSPLGTCIVDGNQKEKIKKKGNK